MRAEIERGGHPRRRRRGLADDMEAGRPQEALGEAPKAGIVVDDESRRLHPADVRTVARLQR